MKPLTQFDIKGFLDRFNDFKDAEITDIEIITPVKLKISFNVQDKSRGYDWIGLEILFDGVLNAKLLEEKKLNFFNLNDGLSIIYGNGLYHCMSGSFKSIDMLEDALCYTVSKSLKFRQTQANFS